MDAREVFYAHSGKFCRKIILENMENFIRALPLCKKLILNKIGKKWAVENFNKKIFVIYSGELWGIV